MILYSRNKKRDNNYILFCLLSQSDSRFQHFQIQHKQRDSRGKPLKYRIVYSCFPFLAEMDKKDIF